MGNPDLEVELDSLGLLFTRLIDDNACQDDAEASNAGFVEVTILSSDSEILPLPKFRRANRKVKFSHPLAYLDSPISYEDPATRSSPHNPAQWSGSYLCWFTKQSGLKTPLRGLRPFY